MSEDTLCHTEFNLYCTAHALYKWPPVDVVGYSALQQAVFFLLRVLLGAVRLCAVSLMQVAA